MPVCAICCEKPSSFQRAATDRSCPCASNTIGSASRCHGGNPASCNSFLTARWCPPRRRLSPPRRGRTRNRAGAAKAGSNASAPAPFGNGNGAMPFHASVQSADASRVPRSPYRRSRYRRKHAPCHASTGVASRRASTSSGTSRAQMPDGGRGKPLASSHAPTSRRASAGGDVRKGSQAKLRVAAS